MQSVLTVMGALSLWMIVGTGQMAGAQQETYFNDFEDPTDPLSEWSPPAIDTTPVGARRFLGQFDNHTVSLTLTDLPPHSSVRVSFDLFIINTWDGHNPPEVGGGPDIWEVSVGDGPTLLHTTFDNCVGEGRRQDYPDPYPGGDHPPQTGAAEINTLGYPLEACGDAVYQLSFTFPHAASSLVLNFSGIGLQGIGDESWGLDNVQVTLGAVLIPIEVQTTLSINPQAAADTFALQATVLLGDSSDGIDPLTEAVTLQAGTSALTIPAGSFYRTPTGTFQFAGDIAGASLQVTLTPLTRATFEIVAHGEGVTLRGIVVPVPVGLTIGNDSGSTTLPVATMRAHSIPPQR